MDVHGRKEQGVNEGVKRYFTQRNMNRKITFYGLSGLQVIGIGMAGLALYLVVGNFGPAILLLIVPVLRLNKRKLSEGDPNYIDTVRITFTKIYHLQDNDRVLIKLGRKWLID